MAFALGSAIAPVMGGKLTDIYGFQSTSDIMAGITLFFALVNFILVFLPKLCTNKKSKIDINFKTIVNDSERADLKIEINTNSSARTSSNVNTSSVSFDD